MLMLLRNPFKFVSFWYTDCMLKLEHVLVQLNWPPDTHVSTAQRLNTGLTVTPMGVEIRADHVLIQTMSGQSVAVLNKKASRALSAHAVSNELKVDAWVLLEIWTKKAEEAMRPGYNRRKRLTFNVDLVISGLKRIAKDFARCLWEEKLFLQIPHEGLSNLPYDNPQSLPLPDFPEEKEPPRDSTRHAVLSRDSEESDEEEEDADSPANLGLLENLMENIEDVFNQTSSQQPLAMAAMDERLKSTPFV